MPKAQFMRGSIDKQGFIKIKNSVLWKEMKRQDTDWEKKYLQEMLQDKTQTGKKNICKRCFWERSIIQNTQKYNILFWMISLTNANHSQ